MMEFKQTQRIHIIGNEFLTVAVSNLGASIQSIRLGGRELCLGFLSQEERIKSGTYCGAVIGRVANRIAEGKFIMNGRVYSLSQNDGENTLHGGSDGFDRRYFAATYPNGILTMTLTSEDGDQGFPGELKLRVEYILDQTSLTVRFSAESDADTVWGPTIHPYFRLGDEDTINETYLKIDADTYTPMDERQIPTGEVRSVIGTPFDFRSEKQIGKEIDAAELRRTNGYDHNFVLRSGHAATAFNERSGIKIDVYTDMPGLHFYSGNFLGGFTGTRTLRPHEGFALEPQFFPNAVNIPAFKQPYLRAGESKSYFIRYEFGVSR